METNQSKSLSLVNMPVVDTSPDAQLENWEFIRGFYGGRTVLVGNIYNDKAKRFTDGVQIRTSLVKKIEITMDGEFDDIRVTTRSGTVYQLVGEGDMPTVRCEPQQVAEDADFEDFSVGEISE